MLPGAAHPRSRGENRSPLHAPFARVGLIPAHAGKTVENVSCFDGERAHPRSRGENTNARTLRAFLTGSSPLTRGKPGRIRAMLPLMGLIPAHAGKTGAPPSTASPGGAHPRSRGEN